MARYNVDLQDDKGNAYQTMANPDSVAEFSPAPSRENIKSGETHRVIFGKIMKYLSEVGNAAYVGLANNCTTTVEGFALDARQGKELMDRINELNRDFAGGQMEIRLNSAGEGEYRRKGADTWLPFKRTPSLVAHGVGVSTTVLSRRYAATGNGYIMVAMSSWSNTALTFSVTKNGSSISPSSQDGVADRNKYLYCYVFSVLKGDNIVATVKSSNGKDAADLYLAMFAIV